MLRPRPVKRKAKLKASKRQHREDSAKHREDSVVSNRKTTQPSPVSPQIVSPPAAPSVQPSAQPAKIPPISWSVVVPTHRRERAIEGLLLGCSVSEAISQSCQGLRTPEARRIFGRGPLRYPWPTRVGVTSDRTHTLIMTIQAMLKSRTDSHSFSAQLKNRIIAYQLGFPIRYSLNKIRQFVRYGLGISKEQMSPGFGDDPLVRAMVISIMLQGCTNNASRWFQHSLAKTHTDPRSLQAAHLVGHATQLAQVTPEEDFDSLQAIHRLADGVEDSELRGMLDCARGALENHRSVSFLAKSLGWGKGVPNDNYATAILGIYSWLRHFQDFRRGVERVTLLGGHCVGPAVIAGALNGVSHGSRCMPEEWTERLSLFPYDSAWMELVIERVKEWPHGAEDIQNSHGVPSRIPLQLYRNVANTCSSCLRRLLRLPFRIL
jgi:ADP-ribosylglycohydrolase